MRKHMLYLFAFTILSAVATFSFAASPILISGNFVNESKEEWTIEDDDHPKPNFSVAVAEGFAAPFDITLTNNGKPGRFFIRLPIGETSIITISQYINYNPTIICKLKVTTIDSTHASIVQIGGETTAPILCTYSGDPSDDSAEIKLTTNHIITGSQHENY